MAKALTAKAVEKMLPDPDRRLEIPDGLLPGFYLVIQPSGAKSWAVRFRANGRTAKVTLGRFPAIELAKARELARDQLLAVAKGRDPAAENRAAKWAGRAIALPTTVGGLCDHYIDLHLKPNVRRWENARGEIDNHIRPRLGNLALTALTRAHVREMTREIGEAYPMAATRALVRLRAVLNWGVEQDLVEANVATGIKRPTREAPVNRILADTELRAVWEATDTLNYPTREFARLLLLSGQRRDDVRLMHWDEIDLDNRSWTIPAERYKSRRPHLVPLSAAMVTILDNLPFKGHGGYVLSRDRGAKPCGNVARPKAALDTAAQVTGWTWHDLRRTMRTGLSRLGIREDIAERVIGHSVGGRLGATYNLYEFAEEKRDALDRWANRLREIVEPPPANVMRLASKR